MLRCLRQREEALGERVACREQQCRHRELHRLQVELQHQHEGKQRQEGVLNGLREKKRGRKPNHPDPRDLELARLHREKKELEVRLRQAETIIEVQKKVSEILGIPLARTNEANT